MLATIPDPCSRHEQYFDLHCARLQPRLTIPAGVSERQCVRVTGDLNTSITRFPAVAQAIQVTREIEQHGRLRTDVDYFITSCSPHTADPVRLLALIRGHWSIEPHHWVRDVVFGEDRSHLRTETAPQILAALRNALLTLLRRTGRTAITAARRYFASHPSRSIALLAHSFPAYR